VGSSSLRPFLSRVLVPSTPRRQDRCMLFDTVLPLPMHLTGPVFCPSRHGRMLNKVPRAGQPLPNTRLAAFPLLDIAVPVVAAAEQALGRQANLNAGRSVAILWLRPSWLLHQSGPSQPFLFLIPLSVKALLPNPDLMPAAQVTRISATQILPL
jgi:hypothetical protein